VVVRGEIDLATAEEFRRALHEAIHVCGRLEIDLADTTFMDSTGLAVLVGAHQQLGPSHAAIVLRDPRPLIRKALEISGVSELVDIQTDDHLPAHTEG
jgi:anti-sigma B factor antagonist